MKQTVVLYPHRVFSHLNPTVELAKLFVDDGFDVTIAIPNIPSHCQSASTISSLISRVSPSHPSISFHHLPPPPLITLPSSDSNIFHLFRLNNPQLLDFLTQLAKTSSVHAVIIDFLCSPALDVTAQLGLPSYFLFCPGASSLCACLNLPKLISETTSPLKDLGDSQLTLPGLPPVAPSDVPRPLLDPNDEAHQEYLSMFTRLAKADGIIVNTYRSLEVRAVSAVHKGQFPPLYCVGPLLGTECDSGEERHECLTWLDAQPKGSVVFLCFGSWSSFAVEQLKEIAIGLEKSGKRFLWVVRYPTTEDPAKPLEALLPGGFLERTAGRGVVLKSWAPQTAVLGHESVGGFVSHCGWNSVLEAVCAGVPMIAWPRSLNTDQGLNKVFLVEEAKLAVEMKGYDEELVSAEEVETKVRWLMESEGGRELKEQAAAAKESAMAAWSPGGSSEAAWAELVSDLKQHQQQHAGTVCCAHRQQPIENPTYLQAQRTPNKHKKNTQIANTRSNEVRPQRLRPRGNQREI